MKKKLLFEEYINEANSFKGKDYYASNNENIFWFDFDSTSNYNNTNNINYEILNFLQKIKVVKIKFYFKHKNTAIQIKDASSGQLHLLFNILFIASMINKNNRRTIILIDEPESSLHPRWQKTYLEDIFSFFYRYNIKVIVATHSPLIISSLDKIRPSFHNENISYAIYEVKNHSLRLVKEDGDKSIEAIFWDIFGVITPENSFLARHIVNIIHDVVDRKMGKDAAIRELKAIDKVAFDDRQTDAVDAAIQIIESKV